MKVVWQTAESNISLHFYVLMTSCDTSKFKESINSGNEKSDPYCGARGWPLVVGVEWTGAGRQWRQLWAGKCLFYPGKISSCVIIYPLGSVWSLSRAPIHHPHPFDADKESVVHHLMERVLLKSLLQFIYKNNPWSFLRNNFIAKNISVAMVISLWILKSSQIKIIVISSRVS